jgi:type VI secretion system protein ImpG
MRTTGNELKDFYRQQLSALREEAVSFGLDNPLAARQLGIGSQQATDPQAELLIQSFAYLTGRLNYQQELDQAALPNALLAHLYPHLAAPVPSMLIAEIVVKPDGANFAQEQILPRHSYVTATASDDKGQRIECRFRTGYDTPLLPLKVSAVAAAPAADYRFQQSERGAQSALRVTIGTGGMGLLHTQGKQRLRFHINTDQASAFPLYDMLSRHLTAIAVCAPAGGMPDIITEVPLAALEWLGFADDQALLQTGAATHPGYRLLQEYFAFRDKFMFFEIGQLPLAGVRDSFELVFLFDRPLDPTLQLGPASLLLNCVPLINLYPKRLEPLALDHADYEMRLQGDIQQHRYCEVHSLQSLESIRPDGGVRLLYPYFSLDQADALADQDYFYITRREASQAKGVCGTELYVSVLDARFDLTQIVDEVIGGKAICTNRDLPQQIRAGQKLHLEGGGPVASIAALGRPTPHRSPELIGGRPWALVSQLSLNQLSLADGPNALAALKDILRLHADPSGARGLGEIDGLKALKPRAVMRRLGNDGWRGFVRGLHIALEMDNTFFTEGSPVLFGSVLRYFFALYATINNVVEVSLETQDTKGAPKQWQAMVGAQTVL